MVSREVELCKYGGEDNAGNWSNEEKEEFYAICIRRRG